MMVIDSYYYIDRTGCEWFNKNNDTETQYFPNEILEEVIP